MNAETKTIEPLVKDVMKHAPPLPPPPPAPNLRRKLVNVMQAVGWVSKRGHNQFHNYDYATEADVAEQVRGAFTEQGLIFLPTVTEVALRDITNDRGKKSTVTRVNLRVTILDADSEESLTLDMPGEGQDGGDKGVYKAITGAEKYALMKLFLIPTGDDPEKDDGHKGNGNATDDVPKITEPQQEALRMLIASANVAMSRFLERYEIATLAEIHADQLDRIQKDLTDYIAKKKAEVAEAAILAAKGKKA